MGLLKKLIPNIIKQEGKYFLYRLLKMPYNRVDLPVSIQQWLPASSGPINFIDVGASQGNFAMSVKQFYGIKKGILIDPILKNTNLLKERFSDALTFEILTMAVSDKVGQAEFFVSESFDVLSSLLPMKHEYHKPFEIPDQVKTVVQTDTLDHIVEANSIKIIDLLKIDVQGAEHLVLNGATGTLKQTKFVYTEFSYKKMYDDSSTFFDLFEILTANNFRLVNTSSAYVLQNGEIVQGDGLFANNKLIQ